MAIEDPKLLIRLRLHSWGLSYGSFWRILHKDLHLQVQVTQELNLRDYGQRRIHAESVLTAAEA